MDLKRRWAAIKQRNTLGLSQEELADLAKVSPSTVKRFEGGSGIRGSAQERLQRALKGGLELLEVSDPTEEKPAAAPPPAKAVPAKPAARKKGPKAAKVAPRKKAAKPRKSSASGSKSGRPASTSRRMAARSVRTQAGR